MIEVMKPAIPRKGNREFFGGFLLCLFMAASTAFPQMEPGSRATSPLPSGWTHDLAGEMVGNPAANATVVAAATLEGLLVVLASGDGTILWRTAVGEPVAAGPLIKNGMIFLAGRGGNLYAWDQFTGKPRWGLRIQAPITVSPGFSRRQDRLLIAIPGKLLVLVPETGEIQSRSVFRGTPATSPVSCRDRILIGTTDGRLLGIHRESLRPTWEVSCGAAPPSLPTCDQNAALVGCGDSITRIGLDKGKVKWEFRTGGRITSRPVIRANRIFAGSFDNDIYILKRKSGHLIHYRVSSHRLVADPLVLGNLFLVIPFTADILQVHTLPNLDPAGSFPVPRPESGTCSSPQAAGPSTAVIGCGSGNTRLIGIPIHTLPAFP